MNEKVLSITATAQGLRITRADHKTSFQRYEDLYQTRSDKNKPVQTADSLYLNAIQRSMYRRLMYGIKEYSAEELRGFSTESIKKIENEHVFAQRVVNALKLKTLYYPYDRLLMAIFPHFKVRENELMYSPVPKGLTLKKLNISTKQVCDEFMKYKLLPTEFFSLSPQNVQL